MALRDSILRARVPQAKGGAVEVDDTFIGNGESLYFAPAAESVQRAIVRGTCSLSINAPTPDKPAIMSCNNGDMQFVDGVLTISGSPSTFDYNEARLNPVDLFGWGYADEQNVLTGVVTRKVQVSAMRANWDWVQQSISGANYFALPKASYPLLVCTHFHQVSTATPANVGEWCEGSGDYLLFNYDGVNDNLADFEDYLEECYQANEAVICLTKRFVDITETETAFPCVSVKGLNSFKYVANDDSNVCLKYRAVYPADNELWYRTKSGNKVSFWVTCFELAERQGTYPSASDIHQEREPNTNVWKITINGAEKIWGMGNYAFNNSDLDFVIFPSSFMHGQTNASMWTGFGGKNFAVGASVISSSFKNSSGNLTKSRTFDHIPANIYCNVKLYYNDSGNVFTDFANTINANSVFINVVSDFTNSTQWLVDNVGHLTLNKPTIWNGTQNLFNYAIRFVYVPTNLVTAYKTHTKYKASAKIFFPIPDCWL